MGSLTPDAILAPHLGDHPASLTWTSAGRSTVLHLDIERTNAPVVALYDCDDHFEGFDVGLSSHVTTDDNTIAQTDAVTVRIDTVGTIRNFSWSWRVDGAIDAGATALYLIIPMTNLTPSAGVVTDEPNAGVGKDDLHHAVGLVHFGP